MTIECVDINTKINYICPNGNHGTITWAEWQRIYSDNEMTEGKLCGCELCRKESSKSEEIEEK